VMRPTFRPTTQIPVSGGPLLHGRITYDGRSKQAVSKNKVEKSAGLLGDGVGCFKNKRNEVMLGMDHDSSILHTIGSLSPILDKCHFVNIIPTEHYLHICIPMSKSANTDRRQREEGTLPSILSQCISQKCWNRTRVGIFGQAV